MVSPPKRALNTGRLLKIATFDQHLLYLIKDKLQEDICTQLPWTIGSIERYRLKFISALCMEIPFEQIRPQSHISSPTSEVNSYS